MIIAPYVVWRCDKSLNKSIWYFNIEWNFHFQLYIVICRMSICDFSIKKHKKTALTISVGY